MKDKLIEVLSIQSESFKQGRMFNYLLEYCHANNLDCFIDDGSIYITKGNAEYYPCVVAHMDTVHRIVEDLTVIEIDGKLTGMNKVKMEQTGIGGDDKVGIFIALQCLERFDDLKVAFFRDEEVGCEGSYNANIKFFSDCSFILQCDRKGNNDFITEASGVKLSGKDFQKAIRKTLFDFGYRFNHGMMTDVMALKELGITCAMANISCGYYNPHYDNEYVVVKDVYNCMNLVFKLIENFGQTRYVCSYTKPVYTYTKYKKSKNRGLNSMATDSNTIHLKDTALARSFDNNQSYLDQSGRCECCDEEAATEYIAEYNMDMCSRCIGAYVRFYGEKK